MDIIWAFLFGTVPWQLWFLAGLAGAIAIAVIFPSRLGMFAAAVVATLTLSTSAYSHGMHWGIDYGTDTERASWQAKVDAERERLRVAHAKELAAERQRTVEAQQDAAERTQERDNAINLAGRDPNAGDIAIPESLAGRLCALPGARCGTGPSGSPARARKVRRVLR